MWGCGDLLAKGSLFGTSAGGAELERRVETAGRSACVTASAQLQGIWRAFPVCMPAAEAKEGAAEPAANAGDAMDGPQSLSEIVAAMERRLQAEISIATV